MIGEAYRLGLEARLEDALAALAVLVRDRARDLAPPGAQHLKDSITAQDNTVVAEAPYAVFVELGTQRMPARPFLRPALLEMRSRITELIHD